MYLSKVYIYIYIICSVKRRECEECERKNERCEVRHGLNGLPTVHASTRSKKMLLLGLWTIWTRVNRGGERMTIPRWDPRRRRWGHRSGNTAPPSRRSLCRTATFPPTSPRGALSREILSDRQRGTTLSRCPRLSVFRKVCWQLRKREREKKIRVVAGDGNRENRENRIPRILRNLSVKLRILVVKEKLRKIIRSYCLNLKLEQWKSWNMEY